MDPTQGWENGSVRWEGTYVLVTCEYGCASRFRIFGTIDPGITISIVFSLIYCHLYLCFAFRVFITKELRQEGAAALCSAGCT